jgi:hypothetical protein
MKRLFVIFGLVALVYAPTVIAPFCSYDAFLEVHRTGFTDAPNPSVVFTTSHWGLGRYRPLNRALNLVTFQVGNGRPGPYRVRNVLSHLACVALVFALSLALFRSPGAAAWGALLFGVHPLTNIAVVGAINTNVVGYALLLGALLLFLRGLRSETLGPALVATSVGVAGLGILTYDPDVVYFPLTALLVAVEARFSGRRPGAGVLAAWLGGSAAIAAGYVGLRALYVPAGKVAASVPGLSSVVKNLVTYGGALLLPLDPVLLHDVLGTPYPSELASAGAAGRGLALVVLFCAAAVAAILAVLAVRRVAPEVRSAAAPGVVFVACSMPVLFLPFLLFAKHASESYEYLPAAFLAILVGVLIDAARRTTPRSALAAGVLLVGLAAAATVSRNVAVLRCGRAAERLVAGLSAGAGNEPSLLVANAPGAERSRRYGFYGFRGTDTVGDGALANPALTAALELERRREGAMVSLLEPDELRRAACEPPETRRPAFWVHADGVVSACRCDVAKETP